MKIMVGYDGSEIAHRALVVAQKRAKALNAELIIFASGAAADVESPKSATLQGRLKDAQVLCDACKITCHLEVSDQKMSVAEDIIRYAAENKVDEIVIGLRRRSQLGKMLFGSTSRQVILDAPCPVLAVK
jgi:nucleotide-binding universal stress UspA family protein